MLGEVVAEPGPVTIDGAFAAIVDRVDQLVALSDGAIARVAVHSWSEAARDDRVAEILRTNIGRVHERWVEVLARAERDGSIRPGIDHDRLARALVGLMPGYLVQGLLLGAVDGPAYSAAVTDLLTATAIEPAAAHA